MQWFPRLKKLEWVVLISLVTGYLALTLANLTKLPIFVDEALYLRWAQIAWHDATWRFISLTDGKQPLFIWLTIPFMKIIHDPLEAGRMTSVIAGLFTMLGMGYLGFLIKDKRLGFFATVLTLCSPYLFFYNRFGIMEGLLVASIVWVVNLSLLLARTERLDVALILGMATGAALLVKSSALFFCLMIPLSYIVTINFKQPFTKSTGKYLLLVAISWVIAATIYNVQRLSPWMHVIAEKNAFFTVPYSEVFADPTRLINNFTDVWRWQYFYTTWPILLLMVYGVYQLIKANGRIAALVGMWLMGPLLGTVAIARLFAPRYIIYVTPFVLFFAAYGLASLKTLRARAITLLVVSILPLILISKLIFDPIHFPYVNVDEGYVNGWPAGNGVKQIAEWASARIKADPSRHLVIYTEGTFGILPHGLELYAQGITQLDIIGLYPIGDIPPAIVTAKAHENPETYLILNNTETHDIPGGLDLVASYPKLRDNPMRLYRVIPR